jgi:hypothetical integral membrane protein (TIGR02206 family)
MENYFARDYHGQPFELFGPPHLISLVLVAAACLLVFSFRRSFNPAARRAIRWTLLAVIYLCEISWHIWKLSTGDWNIQVMLPLWLCSLTVWTMPLLLIWRNKLYYEWVYFMGLIGASQALFTPDLMIYGFPHFRFIEFITVHGTIIIAVIYMTVVEDFRPTWRSLPRVILITDLYWFFCGLVNTNIGSNYLYTQGKLPTPSLLDYLGPWPWYLLSMQCLGILFCILLYLPFAISDTIGRKRPNQIFNNHM